MADRTVRFQVFVNGTYTTLKLSPGQTFEWNGGGPDDEGYYHESIRWALSQDGRVLERYTAAVWRDCDGSGSRFYDDSAEVGSIKAHDIYDGSGRTGMFAQVPDWQVLTSGQRDHFAEAMNY